MGEQNPPDERVKLTKFADQNEMPNANIGKGNSNLSKVKSSWGSQIVRGFSAADKRTKVQNNAAKTKKQQPLLSSNVNVNQKNMLAQSRAKRSLISDMSCSANGSQVHPSALQVHRTKSSGSSDLFFELDHLRSLLQESREREVQLQDELSLCRRENPRVLELEKDLELKKKENDNLVRTVNLLESEKKSLSDQLASLTSVSEKHDDTSSQNEEHEIAIATCSHDLEIEVVELRRLNKELQLQKRSLSCKLSYIESQLANLTKSFESDIVEKIKEEASLLRHTNEDLCKQVEGLQMSRLNEVEELVYLRWVNSCLRNELRNCSVVSTEATDKSPSSEKRSDETVLSSSYKSCENSDCSVKKLKKWPITYEDLQNLECQDKFIDDRWASTEIRRHSISGSQSSAEDLVLNNRRQSDHFMLSKEMEEADTLTSQNYEVGIDKSSPFFNNNLLETNKLTAPIEVEKRVQRIPNPPPRPSSTTSSINIKENGSAGIPSPPLPPPPPPPPKFKSRSTTGMVKRAPEVVEFYHALMKRESRKDALNGGTSDTLDVANVRSSMIDEIENRSSYLLAIKADVETQGEFVNSLIREVNNAVYQDIEDVVAFVKWLDDELCFLVDERAVLKHFEWPEKKADALREAAFGFRDLKKLEYEVSRYEDDPHLPCDIALKRMVSLSEKMERTVYNLLRNRDSSMRHLKQFQIPTDWMLDGGILSKIKFGSVKLAKKYMERVALELQCKGLSEKDSCMDYMLLQGVRFAFRVHQFAGGFDGETMHAFEELRHLALAMNKK